MVIRAIEEGGGLDIGALEYRAKARGREFISVETRATYVAPREVSAAIERAKEVVGVKMVF